jgi:hydro-lyases, Fe-S type, tartrate/fumarate subfamily, beta region
MERYINLPLTRESTAELRIGDTVYLSGVIYTARDAAHKRLVELLGAEGFPFPLEGATLYYVGPTPAAPGQVIGSAGPTTSYRMDAYAPALIEQGLMGMIGKGARDSAVRAAMAETGAIYFGAIGGAGALLSGCVERCEVIAFEDLGPEAVHRLEVRDFPVTVLLDAHGGDLYEEGRKAYLSSVE